MRRTPFPYMGGGEFMDAKSQAEEATEEERLERLQFYYGIRPGTRGKGTPEVFNVLPMDQRPIFEFEMLTADDQQAFQDAFYVDGEPPKRMPPEAIKDIVTRFIKGWKCLNDIDGAAIEYEAKDGRMTDACYGLIASPLRPTLFTMIMARNRLSPREETSVK